MLTATHTKGGMSLSSNLKKQLTNILDEVSTIKELQSIPYFQDESDRMRDRLTDDEFRIAVVGEFSSGKSTFINAMLGQDILKHATTETTAAVTRIINVESDDPRRMTGCVYTRDGNVLQISNLNDLKEYTTTQSERYKDHVPDVIDYVEIYLPFMKINRPVVIVDTPGLNGMADGHREQTIALIQRAHSCIYLIPRGGLGESDIRLITYLTRFQKNFIFIQNFIDELQESEGDSVAEKLSEQHSILSHKIFSQNSECVFEICGISALMELASADHNINRLYADSPNVLTSEDRIKLHNQSGFDKFWDIMNRTFQEDHMDEIQYGGSKRAIANWIQSLIDKISKQEQQAREFFETSRDKHSLEKLEHLREKILSGEQRQRENLQDFIIARGDEIRGEECENLKKKIEDLIIKKYDEMNKIHDIESLDRFEKELPSNIDNDIRSIINDANIKLQQKFQTLYQVLLTKIDEYRGVNSGANLNIESLTLTSLPQSQPSFNITQNRIDNWNKEQEVNKDELGRLYAESKHLDKELSLAKLTAASVQNAQQEIKVQMETDLYKMGSRPPAREYKKSYTYYVPHGGLGIIDSLFGDKEVTGFRIDHDDSAGEMWDQKRAQIQNAFAIRNDSLNKELASAKRRIKYLSDNLDINQEKLKSVSDRIKRLEQTIALEKEKLITEKKYAAEEYMNLRKSSLKKQITSYLLSEESGILTKIELNIKSFAEETEQSFIKLADKQFTEAFNQKLLWIDQVTQEKKPLILQQAEKLNNIVRHLTKIHEEMGLC